MTASIKLCLLGLSGHFSCLVIKGGSSPSNLALSESYTGAIRGSPTFTNNREHLLQNAQHFESDTALCKVCTQSDSYIARCCVKGSLLEVNDRLTKHSKFAELFNREGYIAIIMPEPADWLKVKASLLGLEEYKKLRENS
ncbi:hypothetical protein H0E87_011411 [Populus deltoides]|uniref:Actin-binding transcription modulator n=1 Tax=Populus deltoides TaxID=3696 RepID=A0A8T2YWW3_POPDE|nr:hypothetical protein H0E87_011411 [Populus deltoides]